MRYICDCGNTFEQEECYEGTCPYCGGCGYEPEGRCVLCASAVPDSRIVPGELCRSCAEKTLARFRESLASFREEELQYIDSVIEGNSLTDIAEGRLRYADL